MIIALIILGYVVNIFLNRWLNKIIYKYNGDNIVPFLWLFSLVCTFALLVGVIKALGVKPKSNWFTGKYWKQN